VRALARVTALVAAGSLLIGVPVVVTPAATAASKSSDSVVTSPLAAPTSVVATAGTDSISLTFTPPATDDTVSVANYEFSLDAGATWTPFTPAVTASPVTISGLATGRTYRVKLRAIDNTGVAGAASATSIVKLRTPEPPKPTKPVIFTIDGKVITKYTKVDPGSILRVTNVPRGGRVEIIGDKDPSLVIAVEPTSKVSKWSTGPMRPSASVWARVYDSANKVVDRVRFATKRAENTFSASVFPSNAQDHYGIGIPLVVTFDRSIKDKAAVERALVVTSDKEIGEGGWFWADSTKVVFRPRLYWPGHATITLTGDLTGIEGAEGWWGEKIERTFKTGDPVSLKVNLRKHEMQYLKGGVVEETFPISGGKSGWETPSGTMLITTHESPRRLINPGDPNDPNSESWNVEVTYAMRTTQGGVFIHDATWNYNLGSANTSHGCINMSLADAGKIFRNTDFATPVEATGSRDRVSTSEYLGGYWNYSWPEWKRGSALWTDR